jgi:hypothetical protein
LSGYGEEEMNMDIASNLCSYSPIKRRDKRPWAISTYTGDF